ncbi:MULTISPECIES: hypothetical protein [unclassified Mesorhizobium]|uniref:hypothetical protein n=1 Tax=unclassified Mesorhizobium TaxID=325217 RepID=UPI00112BA492|nr:MULTISPECIES: hypothetical protein [unclassified Mesorhizobium]MBZ9693570.1 hypothetical protein [Mesorhizobium sp. CO1-1-9]TPK17413.1 hypothetical protein FJ543_02565 [Mesorhizobium sp. B2-5-7]
MGRIALEGSVQDLPSNRVDPGRQTQKGGNVRRAAVPPSRTTTDWKRFRSAFARIERLSLKAAEETNRAERLALEELHAAARRAEFKQKNTMAFYKDPEGMLRRIRRAVPSRYWRDIRDDVTSDLTNSTA